MSIVKSINDAKNAEIQVHLLKGSANKAKHRSIGTFVILGSHIQGDPTSFGERS